MRVIIQLTLYVFLLIEPALSQVKFIIDDFEGFANGSTDLKMNGVFAFGNIKVNIDTHKNNSKHNPNYLGGRYIETKVDNDKEYGGWGKGICLSIDLDVRQDYLNFYILKPSEYVDNRIKIQLQEDDNNSKVFEKEVDDAWIYETDLSQINNDWQLVSIPLKQFKDENTGGDGVFNCNYKEGKLLCFIITFPEHSKSRKSRKKESEMSICFDFISFSEGPIVETPISNENKFCALGLWSTEGNSGNFTEIPTEFNNIFKNESDKNIGVIHFFQPFAFDGGNTQNNYPSINRINKVIQAGFIPMITLENHFVNLPSKMMRSDIKQPNLYNIIQGECDNFLMNWAKQIKEVNGTVLLRIFHEFNGNWYPWCISKNDNKPELLGKAFRHIYVIFKNQNVTNVKFIWCPNSMSVPQESWNIMDAYPGDEYVDFVGLDVYNGAGESKIWTSFRKVSIENYFILTKQLPDKPLFICETASRERRIGESESQTKAEWINQMSEALTSDMSNVKLLSWFNERDYFKINSSENSKNSFLNNVLKNDFFKSGPDQLTPLIR
ncbi:MAG: glycosyl hydrolase [Bacteroidota bacterium]